MKFAIAAAILLEPCTGNQSGSTTSSASERRSHRRSVAGRAVPTGTNSRVSVLERHPATIDSFHPRLRSGSSISERNDGLRRSSLALTNHVSRDNDPRGADVGAKLECLPNKNTNSSISADVGILGCGIGEYCLESSSDSTTLGGICIKEHNHQDDLGSIERNVSLHSHMQRYNQRLVSDNHEEASHGSSSERQPHNFLSRLRRLQEQSDANSNFFDFVQYACSYDISPVACDCTTDSESGAIDLSCEYIPPCETKTTPCLGDYTSIDYCLRLTIDAKGTGEDNFDFNFCYGYLSPVDMIYCYQVVSKNDLLACNMFMNDDKCTACNVNPQDSCIEFDCRNTASGRAGNLCIDAPLGDPAFFELLDCPGSCNICGEGGKLTNYNFDLGPILSSNAVTCYSPLLCNGESLTCEELQEIALVAGPIEGNSCSVAPTVDLVALCCSETPPDATPPPSDATETVRCEDFHLDCFSCLENAGCYWCPGDALCLSSPSFEDSVSIFERDYSCKAPEDFTTEICSDPENFFRDPLYSAQQWIFDMINVREVWEKGYTGKQVRVRVNDEGIETSHPEFQGRVDMDASCPAQTEPASSAYENGYSHGTAVASIIGATAGNDVCGVGISPNVTLSSCLFNTNMDFSDLFIYKLESFDISQNSWGRETCVDRDVARRRLQGTECPFSHSESHVFPCLVCDFNDVQNDECTRAIEQHCRFYFREDRLGCLEHLDLTLGGNCDFQSLTNENSNAFARGVTQGRNGKGVIFIFASGNRLYHGSDTNFEGFGTNTRMAMTVGAVGKDGIIATYSTQGASLFVSAPGGDITDSVSNMVTANLNGGCTDSGQGTSFAAPILSGVVALMLEANSLLTYRDVLAIIAKTSRPVDDELDHTAGVNAANRWHSNYYGFGIVNALAAVEASERWEPVGNETMVQAQSALLNIEIPDNEAEPIVESLEMNHTDPLTIESVYIYIKLEHSSRGHLQIKLISPSGTESILSPGRRPENTQQADSQWWKLMSWKFWGENSNGKWKISVVDLKEGDATFEGTCADYEWNLLDKVTCSVLERVEYCGGGQVDPYQIAEQNGEANVIFAHPYYGLTASEACCVCGGGVDTSDLSETIIEWKIVVYGEESSHNGTTPSTPTLSPSLSPSPQPSTVPTFPSVPFHSFPPSSSASISSPDQEIARVEAIGDTYFYRNAIPPEPQPSPTEETMLIRNGLNVQSDAFSLLSFPRQRFQGLDLHSVTDLGDGKNMIHAEICLNRVGRVPSGNTSTFSMCRVKPDSWDVGDGDGSDLETYEGVELARLVLPGDCLGNGSNLKSFEIAPNDTTICVDVSDLLVLQPLGIAQDQESLLETDTGIVMFLIDSLDEGQKVEERFYTLNSDKPPVISYYDVRTVSPSQSPSVGDASESPTPSLQDESSSKKKGMIGLLALLLLCPLPFIFLWLLRREKAETATKDIDETAALQTATFDTAATISVTDDRGTTAVDRTGSYTYRDEDRPISNIEEADGRWEMGDMFASEPLDDGFASDDADANTNDDTFDDETFGSGDEQSSK